MKSLRTVLRVEELGSRTLPSLMGLGMLPRFFQNTTLTATPVRPLLPAGPRYSGTITGQFTVSRPQQNAGLVYALQGTADVVGLGHVAASGTIISVSPGQAGQAVAIVRLGTFRGSVTVKLLGPTQPAASPLPAHFNYEIVAGAGVYFNAHSTGTVDLTLNATAGTFALKFHPA